MLYYSYIQDFSYMILEGLFFNLYIYVSFGWLCFCLFYFYFSIDKLHSQGYASQKRRDLIQLTFIVRGPVYSEQTKYQ